MFCHGENSSSLVILLRLETIAGSEETWSFCLVSPSGKDLLLELRLSLLGTFHPSLWLSDHRARCEERFLRQRKKRRIPVIRIETWSGNSSPVSLQYTTFTGTIWMRSLRVIAERADSCRWNWINNWTIRNWSDMSSFWKWPQPQLAQCVHSISELQANTHDTYPI